MKVLITGATGFIGQKLVSKLIQNNMKVYCLVRQNSDHSKIDESAKIIKYSNTQNLIDIFKEEKFNGIIHLASLFLAEHKVEDIGNLISSNVEFGTSILEACKHSNVKWFINTGTFWQNYENAEYSPVNLYAATKEAFENVAKYYSSSSELIFTTIKLNDTFGPNDTRSKVFNLWAKIAKTNESLDMSPGEQIIDISYIEDVISAYEILISHLDSKQAKSLKNKTFAVKSSHRVSLKDLSKIFEKATNTKLNIVWGAREYREKEVMVPWEDGELVPTWESKFTLEEAIKKTIGEL